jgi:hypothetical protein
MKKPIIIFCLVSIIQSYVAAADSLFPTVNINFSGGIGPVAGKVVHEEEKTEYSVTSSNSTAKSFKPSHISYHIGIWCDITPFNPIMNKKQTAGVQFGVRGRLGYYYFEQEIGDSADTIRDTRYMSFKSALIGPVVRWTPIISESTSWGERLMPVVITGFAQIGPIFGGTMRPGALMQDTGGHTKMKSKITGYRMEFGGGIDYSGNWFPLHVGFNTYYACNVIKMRPNYYTNVPSKTVIHEFDVEMYVGFSI